MLSWQRYLISMVYGWGTLHVGFSRGPRRFRSNGKGPELLGAVERFESILRKRDVLHGGFVIGTLEMKRCGSLIANSMSLVAAGVLVLGVMIGDSVVTSDMVSKY